MFSGGDFFESDLGTRLKASFKPAPCPEHEVDPVPIKARAESKGKQPLVLYQFRPAFALQVSVFSGCLMPTHMGLV